MTTAPPIAPSRFAQSFDRIYILNLPQRSDRRRDMLLELARARFPVPGDRLLFFPALRPADPAGFPSIGARGCFLGHLAMLEQAHRDRLANLLILEDDLAFSPLLSQHDQLLATALQNPSWHFAYFGHVLPPTPSNLCPPRPHPPPRPRRHHPLLRPPPPVFSPLIDFLHLVLTRPPGHPAGGPMHVDGAYSMFRQQNPKFTTLIAHPSLGSQRSSRSDVAPLKWFDRAPLLKQAATLLRRLKAHRTRRPEST